MKKRDIKIDILKAFGIFAVVIGHCLSPTNTAARIIYLINLPIFFIVAGYLYDDKASDSNDIWNFFSKKLKRFWIYYFTYNTFLVLFHNVFIDLKIISAVYEKYYLKDIVFGILNSALFISNEPFSAAMWFIPVMMITMVLFNVINYYCSKFKKKEIVRLILVLICMVTGLYLTKHNMNIGLHYQTCFVVMPFVYAGFLFKKVKFSKIKLWKNLLLTVIIIITTFVSMKYIPGKVDMASNYLWNPFVFYIIACGLTYLLYFACNLFTKLPLQRSIIRLFKYIGEHTIPIMCLHFVTIKLVDIIYINVISHEYDILANFPFSYNKLLPFYLLVSIILPILLELIIKKVRMIILKKFEKRN